MLERSYCWLILWDVDHGQMDHCFRCTCVEFIVLAHPPKPTQPCEGALHDPAHEAGA